MKRERSKQRSTGVQACQVVVGLALVFFATSQPGHPGTFIKSDSLIVPVANAILHPKGYDGTASALQVSVCIDPASQHASAAQEPTMRAVTTWNSLQPIIGGYVPPGTGAEVPEFVHDFESVLLHELGHALVGLGHSNVRPKLPYPDNQIYRYATNSTWGPNGDWNFDFIGLDNRWGSGDDIRGDDINLHWFRADTNDPFFVPVPPTVDSTTYKLSVVDLPAQDTNATNANWSLSLLLGYGDTEAAMFSTMFPQSESRVLSADEVATVRYGMSGLNELAGDGDDYTLTVVHTAFPCDIPLSFTSDQQIVNESALATASVSTLGPIGQTANHFVITAAKIHFNDSNIRWFFSDGPNLRVTKTDFNDISLPGDTLTYTIEVFNNGNISLSGVGLSDVVPADTTFEPAQSHPSWNCTDSTPGSNCTIDIGSLFPGDARTYSFAVTIDDPLSPGVSQISNTATVADDGANGPDIDPSDNSATDTNRMRDIFEDGFESGDTSAWSATVP